MELLKIIGNKILGFTIKIAEYKAKSYRTRLQHRIF